MERTPISIRPEDFPEVFRPLFAGTQVYDSSCSPTARVYFLDCDGGLFLKSAPKGSLAREAEMSRFFYGRGLGPQVLDYISLDRDWLLTARVPGEDCLHPQYTADPKRLCDVTALALRQLHDQPIAGCPAPTRTADYIAAAEENFRAGRYDTTLFPDNWGYASAEDAWAVVQANKHLLQADTLLHGDYCLPNILLDSWHLSGFIDVGRGGVGDKHIDLFWGMWSLMFNLKTDAYRERFLDVYGREAVQPEMFPIISAFEVFL